MSVSDGHQKACQHEAPDNFNSAIRGNKKRQYTCKHVGPGLNDRRYQIHNIRQTILNTVLVNFGRGIGKVKVPSRIKKDQQPKPDKRYQVQTLSFICFHSEDRPRDPSRPECTGKKEKRKYSSLMKKGAFVCHGCPDKPFRELLRSEQKRNYHVGGLRSAAVKMQRRRSCGAQNDRRTKTRNRRKTHIVFLKRYLRINI